MRGLTDMSGTVASQGTSRSKKLSSAYAALAMEADCTQPLILRLHRRKNGGVKEEL